MALRSASALQGRGAERDQLGRLVDTVRAGESAALVVRGEAGIGNTALLNDVAGQASDFGIARVCGMQPEMGAAPRRPAPGYAKRSQPRRLPALTASPEHQLVNCHSFLARDDVGDRVGDIICAQRLDAVSL
jgi:hypothetical protein